MTKPENETGENKDAEGLLQDPAPENDNEQVSETPWAPGGASGEAVDGTPGSNDPLALLVEDNAKLKDQLLRTLADMENLRQRTAREVKDARAYAISNFARDMLNASDNMHRALDAVPEEMRANADTNLKALLEGVELTERELHKALESHGVRKIHPLNERFDPNLHQAMFEVPNPEVANKSIIEVIQAGYVIGDRVLRPALVGVAKGGPKWSDPAPEEVPELDEAAEVVAEKTVGDAPKTDPGSVGSRVDKSA